MQINRYNKPIKTLLTLPLLMSLGILGVPHSAHANEQHQQSIDWSVVNLPETPKTTLSDFAQTHDLVLFTASHCRFCKQFEPVIQQLAVDYGFAVQVFYFGNEKPTAFPAAQTVSEALIANFYVNQSLSTPLLALYSKPDYKGRTLDYLTVQVGAASYDALVNKLKQIINPAS